MKYVGCNIYQQLLSIHIYIIKKSYSPFYQIYRPTYDITMTFWVSLSWCHWMETFTALLALCEGNHRSLVDFPHKGQWRGALMFSLICTWTNVWANNRDAGELRRHCAHYDIIVMYPFSLYPLSVIIIHLCWIIHTWLCIPSGAYVLCYSCTCAGYIFIVCKHTSQLTQLPTSSYCGSGWKSVIIVEKTLDTWWLLMWNYEPTNNK